ncbi:hypothetical protein JCM8115_004325 [Rhodotorula mucilaginosa]
MEGIAGAGVAFRVVVEGGREAKTARRKELGQHFEIYDAELEGLRIALSSAAQFMPTSHKNALHILADNLSAVQRPIDPRSSPGQTIRLAIRQSLLSMEETHPMVRVVVHWVPGHVGIDGNEEADELAKRAVEEGGRALARSTAAREKRARAKRGLRAMAFDPKAASESPSSDGGDSEYDGGARRGDSAMTTRRIAA